MRNKYDNIIGTLFRLYAKSMIREISTLLDDESKELLTIGILQYRSFDNSFHYAPTLKSVFIRPTATDINQDKFPSSKGKLWNYQLMISLAKYFFARKSKNWVNEIFEENEKLETNKASILAFDDNFKNIRLEWKKWYEEHVNKFETVNEESDKKILNQLFYFANFLITIAKWPALISKNPKTYANFINTIINRHDYTDDFSDGKFDKYTACLNTGIHIEWMSQLDGRIPKSELLHILEVCFKHPLNVENKIKIINSYTTNNEDPINRFFINAIARPILASGEFLGITYITWPSRTHEESEKLYKEINTKIQNVFKDSRIANFLLKSKITATRFYLQNINSDLDIHDSSFKKLFNLTHVFSSAHLVAYSEGEKLEFRFLTKNENDYEQKTIIRSERKSDFINHLATILAEDSSKFEKSVSWIDVAKKEIGNSKKENFYDEIKNDIENFNKRLKDYISDDDFNRFASYQITNITSYNFDGKYSLMFFNSNYYPIFNYNQQTANLLKQSYAYDLCNSLNGLIENEEESRDKYIQSRDSLRMMDMSLLHFLKSTLNKKFVSILELDTSDSVANKMMKENIERLEQQLNKYLTVYALERGKDTVSINGIINLWNQKITENSNIQIQPCIFNCGKTIITVKSSIIFFDMLFEEFILNGTDRKIGTPIKLSLNVEINNEEVVFSIINDGSTIPLDKRELLGKKLISDTRGKSGGFGYYIIQFLLRKMGTIGYTDNPNNTNFEIIYDDDNTKFRFNFKLKCY